MQEPDACATELCLIVRVEVHMPSAPSLRATQGKRRRSCISVRVKCCAESLRE